MRDSRFRRLGALVAAAAAVSIILTGCVSDTTETEGTNEPAGGNLRYGFLGSLEYPSDEIGWGLHTGIIQEHLSEIGIDTVETVGLGTGPDLNDALNSGSLDAASYGDGPGTTAYAVGSPTRLIDFSSVVRESIILTAPDGATSLAELEGANVGAVIGSAMHRVLAAYLAAEGISVNWVQGSDTSLLSSGAVDAIATWPYSAEIQELLTDEGYQLAFSTADVDGYEWSLITVSTDSYVSEHPDFPQAWRDARAAAVADILEDPDAFYDWWAELNGTTPDVAEVVFPLDQIATGTDAEIEAGLVVIENAKSALLESGAITTDFEVDEWWVD